MDDKPIAPNAYYDKPPVSRDEYDAFVKEVRRRIEKLADRIEDHAD